MEHIATLYTYKEGSQHSNLIRFFWDQARLTLYRRDEYLVKGICATGPRYQGMEQGGGSGVDFAVVRESQAI